MLLKFWRFHGSAFPRGEQVQVEFKVDRADGLVEGGAVEYRGVAVGSITMVRRDENDQDVIIDALIDNTPPLPGNVTGVIRH